MRPPAVSDSPVLCADLPTIAERDILAPTDRDEPTTTYPDPTLNARHVASRRSQVIQRRLWAAVSEVSRASSRLEPDNRRLADDLSGLTRIDERDDRALEVANRYARRLRRRRERMGLAGSTHKGASQCR